MAEETAKMYVSVEAKFDEAINQLKLLTSELTKSSKGIDTFEKITEKLDSVLKVASGETSVNNQMFETLNSTVKVLDVSIGKLNNSIETLTKKSNNVYKSVDKTIDPLRKQAKALNDVAAQANRFNTGNIAAQFQDIFVTARMNMNPITIGLQQGTQLVYVLQQSKAPLQELIVGFKSLLSPLSLIVVAITALLAKFIQMVDWSKVVEKSLDFLAFVLEKTGKFFEHLWFLLPGVGKAASSVSEKFSEMADEIRNARDEAQGFLGILKGFENLEKELGEREFKLTLEGKTDLEKEEAIARRKVSEYANAQMAKMEKDLGRKLTLDEIKDVELAKDAYQARYLYVVKGEDAAKKAAKAEKERSKEMEKAARAEKKRFEELQKTIESLNNGYDNLAKNYQTKIEDMNFEATLNGLSEEEKLVAEINHEYEKQIKNLEEKALKDGVDIGLFEEKKNKIYQMKEGYIETSLAINKNNEELELYNSVMQTAQSETSTFFKDMRHGLRDGQSAWEAFGNAVNNVLDKILDKLIDIGVEAAFNGISAGGGGKDGWLGSLIKAGASYFMAPGSGKQVYSSAIGPTTTGSNILGASAGGAFSNGIYSSPTVFKFAKGDKFGVMGEAGPEAVIPLKRAHDGSLGVSADGVGGSPVVVNVINNSNAQARTERRQTDQGVEIDVLIDEMIGKKLNTDGTASNTALKAYNNRQLIMR